MVLPVSVCGCYRFLSSGHDSHQEFGGKIAIEYYMLQFTMVTIDLSIHNFMVRDTVTLTT